MAQILCYDVLEQIFTHLPWNDQINNSHIINRKPSQFSIAYKKLKDKNFNPLTQQKSLFTKALYTGNLDICTDALVHLYYKSLDSKNSVDFLELRAQIYNDLKDHDKEQRIDRIWTMYRVWNENLPTN